MLEQKNYDLLGNLKDENDCLISFVDNGYNGYICDVISELADSYIPIYYNEIWEYARDIKEYIEEAQAQGLTDGVNDLEKIFQYGYYEFYTQSLYHNLDTLIYNVIVNEVNEYLETLTEEELDNIDEFELSEKIEEIVEDYDNNKRMSDVTNEAKVIIEALKDGAYSLILEDAE